MNPFTDTDRRTIELARRFAAEPFAYPNSGLLSLIAKLAGETGLPPVEEGETTHILTFVEVPDCGREALYVNGVGVANGMAISARRLAEVLEDILPVDVIEVEKSAEWLECRGGRFPRTLKES